MKKTRRKGTPSKSKIAEFWLKDYLEDKNLEEIKQDLTVFRVYFDGRDKCQTINTLLRYLKLSFIKWFATVRRRLSFIIQSTSISLYPTLKSAAAGSDAKNMTENRVFESEVEIILAEREEIQYKFFRESAGK